MKPVLLFCRSGNALKVLREQGFTLAKHMDGGINAWQAAGLPVTK
jgi:rhodanese-related sulfurtransferase